MFQSKTYNFTTSLYNTSLVARYWAFPQDKMHMQSKVIPVRNLGSRSTTNFTSTQIFTLAALCAIAASSLIVYPPVTLIPYKHGNCTSTGGANRTRHQHHHSKGIEVPLGSCVDIPFFISYTATKPKSEPDVFECSLYIFSGNGCTRDDFITPSLDEVHPKCYKAAMLQTGTLGARSALYTCEGWVLLQAFVRAGLFSHVQRDEMKVILELSARQLCIEECQKWARDDCVGRFLREPMMGQGHALRHLKS